MLQIKTCDLGCYRIVFSVLTESENGNSLLGAKDAGKSESAPLTLDGTILTLRIIIRPKMLDQIAEEKKGI